MSWDLALMIAAVGFALLGLLLTITAWSEPEDRETRPDLAYHVSFCAGLAVLSVYFLVWSAANTGTTLPIDASNQHAVAIGVAGFTLIGAVKVLHNYLVRKRQQIHESRNRVQVLNEKRFETLRGIARTVTYFAGHEKSVVDSVTVARGALAGAGASGQPAPIGVGALPIVFENYPELRSDAAIASLITSIQTAQTELLAGKEQLNHAIRVYNEEIEQFPAVLLARLLRHDPIEYPRVPSEIDGCSIDDIIANLA